MLVSFDLTFFVIFQGIFNSLSLVLTFEEKSKNVREFGTSRKQKCFKVNKSVTLFCPTVPYVIKTIKHILSNFFEWEEKLLLVLSLDNKKNMTFFKRE